MDNKIIETINQEFQMYNIRNTIKELQKIPKFDFKQTRMFIFKLLKEFDTVRLNIINKINLIFKINSKQCSTNENSTNKIITNNINNTINNFINKTRNKSQISTLYKKIANNKTSINKEDINIFNKTFNISTSNKNKCKNISLSNQINHTKTKQKIISENNYDHSFNSPNGNPIKLTKDYIPLNSIKQKEILKKLHFKTKSEIIKKQKIFINPFNNSFKSTKENSNINNNTYSNNINFINSNNTSNINNNDLASQIISFLDNMKLLQDNIVKKDPFINIKEMKMNFEKQKSNLYQQAVDINNNNNNNNNDINLTISNLRKTIEEITKNSQFMITQLRNEIDSKNKNENQLKNNIKYLYIKVSNIINRNNTNNDNNNNYIDINQYIINIETLIINYIDKTDKKIKELTQIKNNTTNNKHEHRYIKNIITKEKSINIISIKQSLLLETYKENEEIKNELIKSTIEIVTLITPYLNLNKNVSNNTTNELLIKKLESDFEKNGIKCALDTLKNNIKEIINLIINLIEKSNKDKEKDNKIIKTDIINKNEHDQYVKLNSNLLLIQNDLIIKLENKNNQIDNLQKKFNDILSCLNNKNKDNENNERFENDKYVIDLFKNEQNKVSILQKAYLDLIKMLAAYIKDGKEIVIDLSNMWHMNPKIKTDDFSMMQLDTEDKGKLNDSDLLIK